MNLKRLIEEHERIALLIHRMQNLLYAATPDVAATLALLRALSDEQGAHLAYEGQFIDTMLRDMDREQARHEADSFSADCAALGEDWALHIDEWSDDCVEADWNNFAVLTLSLLDRLDRRVQRENDILYPLAFRQGVLQFRDIAPRIAAGG